MAYLDCWKWKEGCDMPNNLWLQLTKCYYENCMQWECSRRWIFMFFNFYLFYLFIWDGYGWTALVTYKPYKRPDDSTAERGSTFCQLDKYFCDKEFSRKWYSHYCKFWTRYDTLSYVFSLNNIFFSFKKYESFQYITFENNILQMFQLQPRLKM